MAGSSVSAVMRRRRQPAEVSGVLGTTTPVEHDAVLWRCLTVFPRSQASSVKCRHPGNVIGAVAFPLSPLACSVSTATPHQAQRFVPAQWPLGGDRRRRNRDLERLRHILICHVSEYGCRLGDLA
eukprot:3076162-Pyramimonas_sp.AAC.1